MTTAAFAHHLHRPDAAHGSALLLLHGTPWQLLLPSELELEMQSEAEEKVGVAG